MSHPETLKIDPRSAEQRVEAAMHDLGQQTSVQVSFAVLELTQENPVTTWQMNYGKDSVSVTMQKINATPGQHDTGEMLRPVIRREAYDNFGWLQTIVRNSGVEFYDEDDLQLGIEEENSK